MTQIIVICINVLKKKIIIDSIKYLLSPWIFGQNDMAFNNRISEKAMATHSSTLAWKIPWTEEPGGLQSMGWLGIRHN